MWQTKRARVPGFLRFRNYPTLVFFWPTLQLERNVFVRDGVSRRCFFMLRRALIEVVRIPGTAAVAAIPTTAALTAFPLAADHYQVVHDDLSLVLLLAALFVIPGRSAQRAFDVDGATFLEVFARDF